MKWFSRSPVTFTLLGLVFLTFLMSMVRVPGLSEALALTPDGKPWTFLTYPLAPVFSGSSLFWLILSGVWMWMFGAQVEARNGWKGALLASVGFATLVGLCVFVGAKTLNTYFQLGGPFELGVGFAIVWGLQNRTAKINLFCVLPLSGLLFAGLSCLLLFFRMMDFHPALGLFTLPALGITYFVVQSQRSGAGGVRLDRAARNKAKNTRNILDAAADRQKEREERDKLRQLFERSLIEDPDEKNGS
ncbi:MAG: hypothetical protein JNJ45_01670 [Chthonomonas sp.]|nr:hypothetical protein [Chthonomonas sp.]